jgi:hypothetical protein
MKSLNCCGKTIDKATTFFSLSSAQVSFAMKIWTGLTIHTVTVLLSWK